jgi:ATP-dependent DNA helicase PIF1
MISNGTKDTFAGDYIHLPKDIVIQYKDEHSIDCLIDYVIPDLNKNVCSIEYMCERGIRCTRNDYVDQINARIIDRFPGKAMVFYSFDSVYDD